MREVQPDGRNPKVLGLHAGPRRFAKAPHGDGGVVRLAIAAVVCALVLLAASAANRSSAAPPANIRPDHELELWFKSLRQPATGRLCCSLSDCRFVDFWVRDGRYEVEIDEWRYAVPNDAIIPGIANLTGKAVACYAFSEFRPPAPAGVVYRRPQDLREILCFIPPRPPS